MTTIANFNTDVAGHVAYAPIPSTNVYKTTLAATVAASVTVPSDYEYWFVAFSFQPGTDIWVDFTGATAAVPVSGALVASTSTLNPGARMVKKGSNISIITAATTADVAIEFYALLRGN